MKFLQTQYLKRLFIAAGLVATMIGCEAEKPAPDGAPVEAPSPPAEPVSAIEVAEEPSADQIVFLSQATSYGEGGWGDNEIYRMNRNGSGVTRLTSNRDAETSPTWSGDGNKVVYMCNSTVICWMNPDGSGAEAIHSSSNNDQVFDPVLSPDGKKIAYAEGPPSGSFRDIWVFDLETQVRTNLTASPKARDISPVWHPLGGLAWIRGTYNSNGFLEDAIVYAPGGSDDSFILGAGSTTAYKDDLDVSPDGEEFVYRAQGTSNQTDIYHFDSVNVVETKLTQTATISDTEPSYSPDGSQLVFARKDQPTDTDDELYRMNIDGSGVTRLTFNDHNDGQPDWGEPTPVLSIGDAEGDEGNPGTPATLAFEVKLSTPASELVSVDFAITPISASADDLTVTDGIFNFQPGEQSKTFNVSLAPDETPETNESFKITLSNPDGAALGDGEGRGLIVNDDEEPSPSPSPSATPSASPSPTGPGRIAFSSTRSDGDYDVWTIDPDGTDVDQVTNDAEIDMGPEMSPNGATIVFARIVGSNPSDIYTVPTSGGTPTKVNGAADRTDVSPAYNPQGTGIVWASMSADGTQLLTATPPNGSPSVLADETGDESYPSWGTLSNGHPAVAFDVLTDSGYTIKLKDLTTGVVTDLGEGQHPEISPDGSKLAYASKLHGDLDIYTRDLTNLSSPAAHLTTDSADDVNPTWSLDGSKIAFSTYRDGNAEIYVMNVDGSAQTNITNNPADDFEPSWGPGSPAARSTSDDGSRVDGGGQGSNDRGPSTKYGALIPLLAGSSVAARRLLRRRHRTNP